MAPLPWLIMLEQMAYQQLMRSPTFHRGVEKVVKAVHRARFGIPPDELGGTNIEDQHPRFGQHFIDELRTQLGQVEREQNKQISSKSSNTQSRTSFEQERREDADSAWQEIQQDKQESTQQPFMGNYLEALRGQVGQKKPPP